MTTNSTKSDPVVKWGMTITEGDYLKLIYAEVLRELYKQIREKPTAPPREEK